MASRAHSIAADQLALRFREVRDLTAALAAPLSDADATVQPMDDASPAKWHLAHTTWFFETFVLRDHVPGYRLFDERFAFLFNSYYEAEGARHPRARRGMITRPSLDEVLAWRTHVDAALVDALPRLPSVARDLLALGLQHEQQHQELMQTDLLALFAENPLAPAMWPDRRDPPAPAPEPIRWIERGAGVVEIGHAGDDPSTSLGIDFAFDCEGPRHRALLHPHALADRPVTNAEWRAFIDDGGYRTPSLWLSDGWDWVRREGVEAPLYWRRRDGGWDQFALDGLHAIRPAAPVTHVSYYEADAFARWAGARLPTEAEWETAAEGLDPAAGNQLDQAGPARPMACRTLDPSGPSLSKPGSSPPSKKDSPSTGSGRTEERSGALRQMFGDVWEWTGSAYLPHPGFRPAEGAVGEYNGKFMSGQFVLKGASCATPRGHSRASYRNFFYPHQRWQFTGVRLAKDV